MNWRRGLAALLAIAAVMMNAGCSSGSGSVESEEKNEQYIRNYDDDFTWAGDVITGLSEAGEMAKQLYIPARCTGFEGTLFMSGDEPVEEVIFLGSEDLDIGLQFSGLGTLRGITLPAGLTTVPDLAFYSCDALEKVCVPAAVTTIGKNAFSENDALTTVTFSADALVSIQKNAFKDCTALSQISLPDSVEEIGESAFAGCTALTVFTLPVCVRKIGNSAFRDSGLTDLYIPAGAAPVEVAFDAFSQAEGTLTVHVVKDSWVDIHFDQYFDFDCIKVYQ